MVGQEVGVVGKVVGVSGQEVGVAGQVVYCLSTDHRTHAMAPNTCVHFIFQFCFGSTFRRM